MKTLPKRKQTEAAEPLLVTAKTIARTLSCSSRYVHMLHEAGTIPGYRFGKACIRFKADEVFTALGIPTKEAK